jgi:hypothetical protein
MARETDLMNLMNKLESLENQVRFLSRLESGGVVAVEYAEFTGTHSASLAANGNVQISGLSISHALSNAANSVYLLGMAGVLGHSDSLGRGGLAFEIGGTLSPIGASPGSRTPVTAGGLTSSGIGSYVAQSLMIFAKYAPGVVSSVEYSLHAINVYELTGTVYINRTFGDVNGGGWARGVSALGLLEVAG